MKFREATRADVPAIVALLADDALGRAREGGEMDRYLDAFEAVAANPMHALVVAEDEDGAIIGCYQLSILDGLSLRAARRAQIEGVRVATGHRGRGIGAAMMADAEDRARAAGCALIQLTTNKSRDRAHAFYSRLGFEPTHLGFKRQLD